MQEYRNKEATKYHAVPVLWDTRAFFNREEAKLIYKDIAIFYNTINQANGSTDIDKTLYPGITVTDATVKIDGQLAKEQPAVLIDKPDFNYYYFMAINVYDKDNTYMLGNENANETLKMPAKSIEISFKINGLEKPLADIASGEYVNPETGEKIGTSSNEPAPPTTDEPSKPSTYLEKGASFTSGNFKYKVTKAAASDKETGTVTLTGLAKKGTSAKKLSVGNTVKGSDGVTYKINAIGSKAFSGAKATSITLNKNIKSIPSSAFAKCQKLSSLTLKAKLTKVSKNAFNGCKKTITVKGTSKKANLKLLKKTSYKKFK